MKLISVVIPVFNDAKRLYKCLKALENQSLEKSFFEVIVVDNGSLIKPIYKSDKINIKIIDCQIPGSYAARNKGILASSGDFVAFTDSDCVPDKNWLKNFLYLLNENTKVQMISGDIKYFFKKPLPNIFELYDLLFGFGQKKLFKKGKSVTANLLVKKDIFKKIGMFEVDKFSGSDTTWVKKASRNGTNFIYASDAIIMHPARHSYKMLLDREKRIYGGSFKLHKFDKMNYILKLLTFFYPLRPPINAIKIIIKSQKANYYQKIIIFFILISLRIVSFIEHIKLSHNFKETR